MDNSETATTLGTKTQNEYKNKTQPIKLKRTAKRTLPKQLQSTHVLAKRKQFLLIIRHPPYY